ncbi:MULTISPECIES: hypothetical protein [Luteimonas]|uniref:hypothetical protein n=1 Tax=Luteimonas TaxID=83614 RepID=UPI000C7AF05E|nr:MULTISPECIES: hypothetical protein [Luteimonas]
MAVSTNTKTLLMTLGAALALSACGGGSDSVVSPGEGAFPPAPPPTTPPPTTPPPTTPPPTGGPAADCPTGFTDRGTVAGATLRACELPPVITGSLLVPNLEGTVYQISGKTNVGTDRGADFSNPISGTSAATLTIEPGVTLFASSGNDYLVVNRGSKIAAEGTAEEPITFTARQAIEGDVDAGSIGLWGGIILLGRAPINACPGTTVSGTPECQTAIEGTNGSQYGGNYAADDSGVMRYVRVAYSGFEIAPGNELQGITLGGTGSGTTLEFLQVHNSSDDGIEIFGGSTNLRRIVVTGADDDSLDTDTGWNGGIQFGVVVQRAGGGDRMNEFSSINRTPASSPKIANFTFVGNALAGAAIELNSGTNASFYNTVVTRPAGGTGAGLSCLNIADDNAAAGTFHSVFFSCPTAFNNAKAQTAFEAGTNNVSNQPSTLSSTIINGANENAVPAFATLSSVHAFFENVDYIGGVEDANDTWWTGWTCSLPNQPACEAL